MPVIHGRCAAANYISLRVNGNAEPEQGHYDQGQFSNLQDESPFSSAAGLPRIAPRRQRQLFFERFFSEDQNAIFLGRVFVDLSMEVLRWEYCAVVNSAKVDVKVGVQ